MADRTTKILLAIIALGLWVNLFMNQDALSDIKSDVSSIQADVSSVQSDTSSMQSDVSSVQDDISGIKDDLSAIGDGSCSNDRICP